MTAHNDDPPINDTQLAEPNNKIQRFLHNLARGIKKGFGGRRAPRYTRVSIAGILGIWFLAAAYLFLTPRSYVGEFTLILPGAGSGATVNLNTLGQASSMSESAFANTRVSPTESYKRLLLSDRVLSAAEAKAEIDRFPKPRIKLLDQTQFMEVYVTASSPGEARDLAVALEAAFLQEIDHLRKSERQQREAGYRDTLSEFEKNVSEARAALLSHQTETGLTSIDQFKNRIEVIENLNVEINRSQIDEAEAKERLQALLKILNISDSEASAALTYAADPVFIKLAQNFALIEAGLAEVSYKFGENHPKRIALNRERTGLRREIMARGRIIAGATPENTLSTARKLVGAEYTALLKEIVEAAARHQTLSQRTASLTETLERERAFVTELSVDAAKLEDLNHALQVAEAVFRSAIARIDTTKSDSFASYPLVQTIEAPSASGKPSSPIPALAIIGAVGATVLYLMGLLLLCLRLPLLNALLKKN